MPPPEKIYSPANSNREPISTDRGSPTSTRDGHVVGSNIPPSTGHAAGARSRAYHRQEQAISLAVAEALSLAGHHPRPRPAISAGEAPPTASSLATIPQPLPAMGSPPSLHARQPSFDETSSLLQSVPPPAYSPPQEGMALHIAPSQNYNTIDNPGTLPQDISFTRQPQSMGHPEDLSVPEPAWRRQTPARSRVRNCCRLVLLAVLFLVVSSSLLASIVEMTRNHGDSGSPRTSPSPSLPGIGSPTDGRQPDPSGDPSGSSYCSTATIHRSQPVRVDIGSTRDLWVSQTHKDHSGYHSGSSVSTAGRTILRRLSTDDTPTGYITVDVWLTHEGLSVDLDLRPDSNVFTVYSPRYVEGLDGNEQKCVSIEITVWLPSTAKFDNINIDTEQLSVEVFDGLVVDVADTIKIRTISGKVTFPPFDHDDPTITIPKGKHKTSPEWGIISTISTPSQLFEGAPHGISSREIRIHTASGSIGGAYSLYDLLEMTTISGTIDVAVAPQKAGKSDVPAVMSLDTKSGSITARLPVYANPSIPRRDYRTAVTTISGTIRGSYYIGSSATFSASSADIAIAALPFHSDKESVFETETISGTHDITILPFPTSLTGDDHQDNDADPDWVDVGAGDPYKIVLPPTLRPGRSTSHVGVGAETPALTRLQSSHKAKSGTLKLQYPSSWAGEVEMLSMSGNLRVSGEGLNKLYDGRDGRGFHRVVARKDGSGGHMSKVSAETISGSVDFQLA